MLKMTNLDDLRSDIQREIEIINLGILDNKSNAGILKPIQNKLIEWEIFLLDYMEKGY